MSLAALLGYASKSTTLIIIIIIKSYVIMHLAIFMDSDATFFWFEVISKIQLKFSAYQMKYYVQYIKDICICF
jgi:hypothetical protein